jgi:hypothetical protein
MRGGFNLAVFLLAGMVLTLPVSAQDGPDSDNDGLPDGLEIEFGTDPNDPDSDDDGLSDSEEINVFGTDPNDPDSDDGGVPDGEEIERGLNPLDPFDDTEVIVSGGSLFGCSVGGAGGGTEKSQRGDLALLAMTLGIAAFWGRRKRG